MQERRGASLQALVNGWRQPDLVLRTYVEESSEDRAWSNTTLAVDAERKSPYRWNEGCSSLLHNYFRYMTLSWDTFPKFFKDRNYLSNVLCTVPSHLHSSGCTVGIWSIIKTLSGHGKILKGRKERRKILLFVHDRNLFLFPKSVTKNENS